MSRELNYHTDNRLAAVIEEVHVARDNDHGGFSTDILLDFQDGGYQALGGLHLDKDGAIAMAKEICALFGVDASGQLIGKHCFGLKSFSGWNETLVGLENDKGQRWTVRNFVRRFYPQTKHEDALAERKENISRDIENMKRRIADRQRELVMIREKFVDWDAQ